MSTPKVKHRDKNYYQKQLTRLTEKRDLLRQTFKVNKGGRGKRVTSDWYQRAVAEINIKISSTRQMIRRHEQRSKPVKELAELVRKFTGTALHNNAHGMEKGDINARYLFYKMGLEQDMRAVDLINFTRASRADVAHRARLTFTRSFRTKPENRKLWLEFKQFIEHQRD